MSQTNSLKEWYQYLEGLRNYYGWSAEEWDDVDRNFQSLVQRSNDKNLYMGIVGEFSAGKSTFINALLGTELLKEDILPGTTCATTLIRQGKYFEVEISRTDSPDVVYYTKTESLFERAAAFVLQKLSIKVRLRKQLEKAKEFIHKYTADEDIAQNVASVTIYLPYKAPIFANDVVIVDTPGINADNPRHQEVTENTMRDLCDLAIVLTPAPAPCSQTLISFIRDHAESFHDYCMCLASQIDKVRPKERERQLKYISDRFRSEGLSFSKIYAISAYYTIHKDRRIKAEKAEEAKQFRDDFANVVSVICEELKRNRNTILSTKLQQILEHIVNVILVPMFQRTSDEYQSRYEALRQNQLSDFDSFIQRWTEDTVNKFSHGFVKKHEIEDTISEAKEQFVSQLNASIAAATTKSELKAIVTQEHIESVIASVQKNCINAWIESVQKRFVTLAEGLLENFRTNFNNEFRNLAGKLDVEACPEKIDIPALNVVAGESVDSISKSITGDQWTKVGATTAGVVIGTMIMPGIGTLIGAGIGSMIGAFFGKSLQDYKKEAREAVSDIGNQWTNGLADQISSEILQPYFQGLGNNLAASIEKFAVFKSEVESIIKEEKAQQENLKSVIEQAQSDITRFRWLLSNPESLYVTH